jgi:1-aminocyclopropane-1-carboxylate deaminase/D-cysteine desulfhydrase-like pyridoxal-dependent ACC family enzyme
VIPLFEHYPILGERLPYTSLGGFPTPVEKLERSGEEIGVDLFYIKGDDLSGTGKQAGAQWLRSRQRR